MALLHSSLIQLHLLVGHNPRMSSKIFRFRKAVKENQAWNVELDALFTSGQVISEGTFSDEQGGVLVLRSDSTDLIANDPLVLQGGFRTK